MRKKKINERAVQMQIGWYAPKLILGDTLLGQRHTEEVTGLFVWLVLAHNIYTQLCAHM